MNTSKVQDFQLFDLESSGWMGLDNLPNKIRNLEGGMGWICWGEELSFLEQEKRKNLEKMNGRREEGRKEGFCDITGAKGRGRWRHLLFSLSM